MIRAQAAPEGQKRASGEASDRDAEALVDALEDPLRDPLVPVGSAATNTRGRGGEPVQRAVVWKARNHRDTALDNFVNAVDTATQAGAQAALTTPDALGGGDGYTALWKDTADILIALRDEDDAVDPASDAARTARSLGSARYGYAVEAYVNGNLDGPRGQLPADHTVALQAGRGATRPDFVVKGADDADVGWFDVTSDASVGHIDRKTGAGWVTKPYVAEVTYPALDVTALATGRTSIGQRVAIRNAYQRRQAAWDAFVGGKRILFDRQYVHHLNERTSKAAKQEATVAAFRDVFFERYTPRYAKGLLRSFGYDPKRHGYGAGGAKADGDAILDDMYRSSEEG